MIQILTAPVKTTARNKLNADAKYADVQKKTGTCRERGKTQEEPTKEQMQNKVRTTLEQTNDQRFESERVMRETCSKKQKKLITARAEAEGW